MLNYKYHAENNFPPHISLEAQKCQMNLLSHASAEILPTNRSSYYRHMKTHKNENVKVNDISGVNDAVRDPEKEAMKAENEELRKMVMNLA